MISRRLFLQGLSLGTATGLAQTSFAASATTPHPPQKRLNLRNLHTNEALDVIYWENGQYLADNLAQINRLLRDHRSDEVIDMDTLLIDSLFELSQELGCRNEIHVISGYRSPATNEKLRKQGRRVAKNSMHLHGKAIDIRVPECSLNNVHQAALNLAVGGVGYYSKSQFIHLDTGRVRRWGY